MDFTDGQTNATGTRVKTNESSSTMKWVRKGMNTESSRWALGLIYIIAVATIWIIASYIVQSVVDSGISPFLITYICNSLFLIYIPIVETARYLEDSVVLSQFKQQVVRYAHQPGDAENANLLTVNEFHEDQAFDTSENQLKLHGLDAVSTSIASSPCISAGVRTEITEGLDEKGRWTRLRVAKVSFLICPFWFFAQLCFNLSLKYTTVTSNTILSSTSSLFTFLVALAFLGEAFTWLKLMSVLLCMAGTIIVSLGDSHSAANAIATNPLLGDILTLSSAGLYSVYITLIRKKLPGEEDGQGQASTALFLGYLGFFNMLIFLPVVLVLNFTSLEPFHKLTWTQVGLVVGKGLLDNVLSDYLWAKAIHLTTTTVATAGLTVQVPIAALVDTLTGHAPNLLDYIGAAAVLIGFAGINIPSNAFQTEREFQNEQEMKDLHFQRDAGIAEVL